MPFTSENAFLMRQRACGLRRAAFWRALGFPNLVLARAARQRKVRERQLQAKKEAALRPYLESIRDDL